MHAYVTSNTGKSEDEYLKSHGLCRRMTKLLQIIRKMVWLSILDANDRTHFAKRLRNTCVT